MPSQAKLFYELGSVKIRLADRKVKYVESAFPQVHRDLRRRQRRGIVHGCDVIAKQESARRIWCYLSSDDL